jgi:hypothetical protein
MKCEGVCPMARSENVKVTWEKDRPLSTPLIKRELQYNGFNVSVLVPLELKDGIVLLHNSQICKSIGARLTQFRYDKLLTECGRKGSCRHRSSSERYSFTVSKLD